MKKILFLLIFFTVSLSAQNKFAKYWLDPEGKEVKDKFMANLTKIYPDNAMAFRWFNYWSIKFLFTRLLAIHEAKNPNIPMVKRTIIMFLKVKTIG